MKIIPIALANHYASGSTTTAEALRITRTDGEVFGFTSSDQSATIEGVLYDASQGLDISSIATSAALSVDNLELTTLDDGSLFAREDVLAGVWQNASFVIFRYNWAAPEDGVEYLLAGNIGMVRLLRGAIVCELRGLQQYLQQAVGSVTSKTCRARFADYPAPNGNNRCRLGEAAWRDTLEVTDVVDSRQFTAEPVAGTPGDSSFASVALLLQGNGANDSTTITDSSPTPRACTAVGNARLRTVAGGGQVKFGTASIYVDGTGDCITIADTPDISLTGAFTIEGWVYVSAASGANQALITLVGPNWELYRRPASGNALTLYDGSSNQIIGGTAIATGGWLHWAWVRNASVHTIYLGGVAQGTYAHSGTINPTSIVLGAYNAAGTSEPMTGYFDDVRITVGVARYTGAFTPPAAEFYPNAPGDATPRDEDWYSEGSVICVTGANAGLEARVKTYSAGREFLLSSKLPREIEVGDTFTALAGCRKRLQEDCRDKFDNVLNFAAEPHMPGIDELTQTPEVQA